jgi:Protein of unknown function (DUF3788)
MSASVFDDKTVQPDNESLLGAMGKTAKHWQKIRTNLENEYGALIEEWKFYGPKTGWLLKVLRKKRNLFFLIPLQDSFHISFTFGEKAVAAVLEGVFPDEVKEELKNARKYAEGRGVRIDVKTAQIAKTILKLVAVKVDN